MDTGTRGELIAASLSVGEITEYLNVDSLAYLDIERLKVATGAHGAGFCDACFTGNYPIDVPVSLRKGVLELDDAAAPDVDSGADTLMLLFDDEHLLPADPPRSPSTPRRSARPVPGSSTIWIREPVPATLRARSHHPRRG
jgi:amidophosphoribosyltransferase